MLQINKYYCRKNFVYKFDCFLTVIVVTSTTCVSQHLQCPSLPLNLCQVLVITMWLIMKAPLNTICLVLPLSRRPVDGQGEYLERRTHQGQVCYVTEDNKNEPHSLGPSVVCVVLDKVYGIKPLAMFGKF